MAAHHLHSSVPGCTADDDDVPQAAITNQLLRQLQVAWAARFNLRLLMNTEGALVL